jgi:Arc/MetJ family transcription regulator
LPHESVGCSVAPPTRPRSLRRHEVAFAPTVVALTRPWTQAHTVRMKRTNLVLDERLLLEAVRLSGERTYSGAVMKALTDYVRRIKAGRILELAGSGLWEGDLSVMRGDRPGRRPRRRSVAPR